MRKIRIMAHISLDGVISPGGPNEDSDYAHGGWTAPYRTPAGTAAVAEAQGKSTSTGGFQRFCRSPAPVN